MAASLLRMARGVYESRRLLEESIAMARSDRPSWMRCASSTPPVATIVITAALSDALHSR